MLIYVECAMNQPPRFWGSSEDEYVFMGKRQVVYANYPTEIIVGSV
jgi:hypothetical protein